MSKETKHKILEINQPNSKITYVISFIVVLSFFLPFIYNYWFYKDTIPSLIIGYIILFFSLVPLCIFGLFCILFLKVKYIFALFVIYYLLVYYGSCLSIYPYIIISILLVLYFKQLIWISDQLDNVTKLLKEQKEEKK